MVKSRETFTLYALLIGIDNYLPNELPSGLYYKSLSGCVRDILRIEGFLRTDLGVPAERVLKLTSSKSDDHMPPEPPEQWPTYENIVNAFRKLETLTQSGDQVYIHYSGHGGRALTTNAFRDIKGPNGIDQVLVPMDLGNSEGHYLRDHELQYLLQKLVDKDLLVTVVLDCCHAGGLTRGVKLEVQGYTLLSACSASQYALECAFDAKVTHGALTYWLLESFKQIGRPGFTYKMLHDRLLAKVHGQFEGQTPQLHGNGDREVFGTVEWPMQTGVTVIQVHTDEILLNAGQAHGLVRGSQFSVFSLFETDISRVSNSTAIIEVIETEATTSRARIVSYLCSEAIEPGAQAVLVDPGQGLRQRVQFTSRTEADLPALKEIEQVLEQTPGGFVTLARNDDVVDYLVSVSLEGKFIICDGLGRIIPNLKPSLLIKDSTAPYRLIERLVHLTRYFRVRDLYNNAPNYALAGALLIEIFPGGKISEERSEEQSHTLDEINVNDGEWVRLRVRNNSSVVLNITALQLRPDWTIKQVYPADASSFEPLDPGREIVLSVPISLPADYKSGRTIFKVFGTLRPTSFRWLELGALDSIENENCKPLVAGVLNRLQDAKLVGSTLLPITGKSAMRGMTVAVSRCDEWIVQDLRIQIQRARDTPKGNASCDV